MFKVTFRDAKDDRKLSDQISMYGIPEPGEAVSLREKEGHGYNKFGRVTGRRWNIITKAPGGFEVDVYVTIDK